MKLTGAAGLMALALTAILVLVLMGAEPVVLLPAVLGLVVVEGLKVAFVVRRTAALQANAQATPESGARAQTPPALLAETASMILDVLILLGLWKATGGDIRQVAVLTFCGAFALSRLAGWMAVSHYLWK